MWTDLAFLDAQDTVLKTVIKVISAQMVQDSLHRFTVHYPLK